MRAHLLAAVLSAVLSIPTARATVLISGDAGGKMADYAARFYKLRQSGEPVVIDGPCLSACTMVLGLVPRDRVCATGNAVLGFHAAWEFDRAGARVASPGGTRALMRVYPAAVRAWIARRGGLAPEMKFMRGRDLAAIVPSCEATRRTASTNGRRMRVRETSAAAARRASFGASLQRAATARH